MIKLLEECQAQDVIKVADELYVICSSFKGHWKNLVAICITSPDVCQKVLTAGGLKVEVVGKLKYIIWNKVNETGPNTSDDKCST